MSPILTTQDVINSMKAYLAAQRPDISTQSGTTVADVVIDSPAQEFGTVYTTLQQTQELQSLEFANQMTTEQLDAFAANYGMTRLPGTPSTSTITFRIRNYNFGSSTINISAGTVVSTVSSTTTPAVTFTTSSALVFLPSLAPSYFNPVSGYYEQLVIVTSSSIGATNNVGAGTITQLVTSVPGIDAVINTIAATGGTDIESNVTFAQRIVIKLSGNNVGTPNGILSIVEATSGVIQAIIVGPNDPEMQRNQFGGSVDVYVRGQILSSVFDTPMYTTAGAQYFVLAHQPASSVSSVTGIRGGNPYTFAPGADYNFVENPNTLFAGSDRAGSYITFDLSTTFTVVTVTDGSHLVVNNTAGMQIGSVITQGTFSTTITAIPDLTHITVVNTTGFAPGSASFTGLKPDNSTQLTITYTYDSLIETIQNFFNNDSNHIVASDILIREALEALIGVTETITVLPGYVAATVVTNVQTALTNYINNLGLGAIIDLSDIVTQTELVAGVDAVNLSTLSMSSTIGVVVVTVPPGQRLTIGKNAYTQAGTLIITSA
jgi:uncharacterized phage protein gp47/JayE